MADITPHTESIEETDNTIPENKKSISGRQKKKHGFLYGCVVFIVCVLCLCVVSTGAFLAYSVLDGGDPAEFLPEHHIVYANIPSAGSFVKEILSVHTLDAGLTELHNPQLQGLLRSLRVSPLLSSRWFPFAANIRIDAALYPEGYAAIAKLGVRSALTRLLPFILKLYPDAVLSVKGLRPETSNGMQYWVYTVNKNTTVYAGFYKDMLIVSPVRELFFAAYTEKQSEQVYAVKRFIKNTKKGSLKILSDLNHLKNGLIQGSPLAASVLKALTFSEKAGLRLSLKNEAVSLSGSGVWESGDEKLQRIFKQRSGIPGILTRLPQSASYVTFLNLGEPSFLFENAAHLLPKSVLNAYTSASKGTAFLFKKDIEALLFSWMGAEIGVFGIEQTASPVFFVSLKDEQLCRNTFESVFQSILLYKDVSAVADGLRIPRIAFPESIKQLLRAFSIELPSPFYVIKDGYLYLSQSAETLSAAVSEVSKGKLLVKTEAWQETIPGFASQRNSIEHALSESSFFLYYTLEEHIPFFLKQSGVLRNVLKDYGRGVLSVRLSSDQTIAFELLAQKTGKKSLGELPSFPYRCDMPITSQLAVGKNPVRIPYAYWTSGSTVYALNLADQTRHSIKLDDRAFFVLKKSGDTVEAVWIVSSRGTVYKTDAELRPYSGYPLLSGERCSSEPQLVNDGIVVSLSARPALLFVHDDGSWIISEPMHTKLKQPPAVLDNSIAALPRSFESLLYLFNMDGVLQYGYPAEIDSIAAVQPILYRHNGQELYAAVLTEQGGFFLKPCMRDGGESELEYRLDLAASCKTAPVYDPAAGVFYTVTGSGYLYKINTRAEILQRILLKQKYADDYMLSLLDADGNGSTDIFVSGGGNAVYAYTADLVPLSGFPVGGTGKPNLIDVDGDGASELVVCGIDNTIHAYTRAGSGVRK